MIMSKILISVVLILTLGIVSCKKGNTNIVHFNPTGHVISTLGPGMRLVVRVSGQNFYNFSSENISVESYGTQWKSFKVPVSEMNNIAQNLSNTTIFKWKFMTAESPFPVSECELLIYGGHNDMTNVNYDYMCSIGEGNSAIDILKELSKSFSGEANSIFDEIIGLL
jgi:hypothetical protein